MIGLALAAAACSSDPEVPTTPVPDGGVQPAPTMVTPAPTPTPTTPPAPTTGPCDGAMQLSLQTAIQQKAKQDLGPGMKTDGNLVCEMIAESGAVSAPFTFAPGKCYSIIAYAFPNVTEIDIRAKPDLGPNPQPPLSLLANTTVAQDSDTGPVAVIGKGKDCFKHPGGLVQIPFAAKAEVTARAGGGPVAVQVYSK
jgi:hypothetical protein